LQWRNNLATDGKSNSSLDLDDELGEDETNSTLKDSKTAVDKNTNPPTKQANTESK
jgi:hypothetical protein